MPASHKHRLPFHLRFFFTLRLIGAAFGLSWAGLLVGQPIISEFMASNDSTVQDDDGDFSDWIEIHNPGDSSINLAGWYLTDDADEKTKWQFPAITLEADAYLLVFASDEDRTDPAAPLHTNFRLSAGGEYLGLIRPDGITVASEFAPEYPGQTADISYGITQPAPGAGEPELGFFTEPTPGASNGGSDSILILDEVVFSRTSGPFIGDTSLTLSGAQDDQVIRYKIVAPSAAGGAFENPTAADPLYTAPIPLTESVVIRAAIFSADGERFGPMSTHHFLEVDDSSPDRVDTFSSQLPLIVFDNHGFGPMERDRIARPAWLYTFWQEPNVPTSITETPDLAAGLEFEVRGQTSSLFPKKSYRFDLVDYLGLKIEESLTGRANFNEWAVIGPWDYDRSYLRNALTYGLSNSMGRWAADTRLVEAFLNADGDALELSDYVGVYVITDQLEIEPGRLDIEEISAADNSGEDITGGYALEIDEIDERKHSWLTDNGYPNELGARFLIDTPKIDAITPEQIDYIQSYVQSLEDALITGSEQNWSNRSYLQYMDRASWIDYHLLNTFVKNVDFFWRGSKFYKDRGKRLMAGPVWDFDRSLGSSDPRDDNPEEWNATPFTDQGYAVNFWTEQWFNYITADPDYVQGWFDRWQEVRTGPFTDEALSARLRDLADQIGPAAAARDAARWPTNQSEQGDFAAEIDFMEDWLLTRANWIDGNHPAPPTVLDNPDGSTTVTPQLGTELIYTVNGADPRLSGGAIAPDALRSSVPVEFPSGSLFRARAYAQSDRPAPNTSWSRAVPGSIGAPYQPAPRLVNLSSRALVQAGDNILISGLAINHADNKRVLLRGIGPTLRNFGVTDALSDPVIRVFDANGTLVAENAGWSDAENAEDVSDTAERLGAFPLAENSGDAALLIELPVGRYTVHLDSVSGTNGTGLTEAYEVDDLGSLLNISVRGTIDGTVSPLIAGFVVTGDQPKRVLIRGVGPSLADFGVSDFINDPSLRIESGGETVATNDDWHEGDTTLMAAVNQRVGAFNLDENSADAAVVVTLPPGVYTAVIAGADGDAGLALVEVYEVE
jgi:hypothetical protein